MHILVRKGWSVDCAVSVVDYAEEMIDKRICLRSAIFILDVSDPLTSYRTWRDGMEHALYNIWSCRF